jgi:polysaccharide biosynthesis/export protein
MFVREYLAMSMRKFAGAAFRSATAVVFSAIVMATGAAAEYRLKSGDTIELTVWQEPKLSRNLIIAPDGKISVPLVGNIGVVGLTVEDLAKRIQGKLSAQYNGELDVSVALTRMAEERQIFDESRDKAAGNIFYVTGEVQKPGEYKFEESISLIQALAVAGGLGPFAAGKRIKVRRKIAGQETLHEFDYDSFIAGEYMEGNITLRKGDVVIVPEKRIFE